MNWLVKICKESEKFSLGLTLFGIGIMVIIYLL